MDGLTASKHLREAGVTTPIIALTANAMESDRRKCEDCGMNMFVVRALCLFAFFSLPCECVYDSGCLTLALFLLFVCCPQPKPFSRIELTQAVQKCLAAATASANSAIPGSTSANATATANAAPPPASALASSSSSASTSSSASASAPAASPPSSAP